MKTLTFPGCILIFAVLACSSSKSQPSAEIGNNKIDSTDPPVAAANTGNKITPDDQARVLVGLDRGLKSAVDADDSDVKRVRFLLNGLIATTKESAFDIGFGVDAAATDIENNFGRKVSRQQLLEDMFKNYATLMKTAKGEKFKDVVRLWALMKYAKMNVQEQIEKYITSQPEPKRSDMQELHRIILEVMPACKLWFLDGKNSEGKTVSNPNIGYGSDTMKYADGTTREFYQIGLSKQNRDLCLYPWYRR